jgi:L-threonine-O-3-phosphate decarboxylase
MLEHGGRLLQAVSRYGRPREQWVDLSTGINPVAWEGAPVPMASWNRLPEEEDGLQEAAESYYGAREVLPISGSQAAIQALPRLRARSRVGVLAVSYNEHGCRWKQAGHDVVPLAAIDFATAVDKLDVVIICNPNNPTGERFTPAELLEWHTRLSGRGGWLVVDEAFADPTPDISLVPCANREGLIVLRSLGKFFGLAGARVGFVLSAHTLLKALEEWLGPWTLSGPSRWVARAALMDRQWQQATRLRLKNDSQRLCGLLTRYGLEPVGGCDLFQWAPHPSALEIHEALAQQGILTRHFGSIPSLRFGLPRAAEDWRRLEAALGTLLSRQTRT